jgi:hypothetical protein
MRHLDMTQKGPLYTEAAIIRTADPVALEGFILSVVRLE